MNGQHMAEEIREQPAVLERILIDGLAEIRDVARHISRRNPRFALFVARGTSDHAALYAKYLVETRLGWAAGLVSPSTMTVYDASPRLTDVLFVAVSQSGGSPDLIEPMHRARAAGAVTVAVTNAPGSALAKAAEYHLDVRAGVERAVAATKSYTAELLTLFLLLDCLSGSDGEEARPLPERARQVLALEPEVGRISPRYRFAEQLVITARGYNYPTAREAALKLMETSYIVAHAFSGADLLHGPMAMIDRGFPVIAIAPGGAGSAALLPVLERLRSTGADTLVVGDRESGLLGTVTLPLDESELEVLSPILAILPLQQLAWHLALERGEDPDQPRGLTKVTRTR
jgi:glucosamine--fructose-6-phosphate aminotransferase (isomerizing)